MIDLLKTELAVLQKISSAAVRAENGATLLEQVLDILSCEMSMLRGTFTLRHGDTFCIEVSHGLDEGERRRGIYRLGVGITGTVAETGTPCLVPDISKDNRFLNLTGARAEVRGISFLCVPVMHREDVIGTLSIDCEKEPLPRLQEKLRFLEIVGSLAAEAVAERLQAGKERDALKRENLQLREFIGEAEGLGQIVGNSALIRGVCDEIRQVAPLDVPALIRGASGTGKELAAAEIHARSSRAGKPFVKLNCAALPEHLLEAELFGYEKGSFSGATSRRSGRIADADGGTLFLDEIGELSPALQIKILQLIQEKTYRRLGASAESRADVRFIAATSRNLEEMLSQGKFLEEFFYRINVFPIILPELSKRRCDIIPLAEHFIRKFNLRYGKKIRRLSTPAINLLVSYIWPGNVRELEACIERAVLTARDECIRSYNLPPSLQNDSAGDTRLRSDDLTLPYKTLVDEFERELLVESLKRHEGNMSAAARELRLSARLMHYKVHKLGIELKPMKN
ncbi:MAG: sigma 54-interacting transcriptional regulator [Opitutales bacterium]|nr:sigma 54-interacting transcriptional regulator [Opitutales bacterium]